jgi:hypothetical protein
VAGVDLPRLVTLPNARRCRFGQRRLRRFYTPADRRALGAEPRLRGREGYGGAGTVGLPCWIERAGARWADALSDAPRPLLE